MATFRVHVHVAVGFELIVYKSRRADDSDEPCYLRPPKILFVEAEQTEDLPIDALPEQPTELRSNSLNQRDLVPGHCSKVNAGRKRSCDAGAW